MGEVLDGLDGYRALHAGAGAPIGRDAISVFGPEAGVYLQGQLSQDVVGLEVGATTWSWVLQPTGKVDALLRVTRTEDDTWVLDTDGGFGDAVVTRLTRFKLRTKADVERLPWQGWGLRGTDIPSLGASVESDAVVAGVRVDGGWPGLGGVDLLGPAPVVPPRLPEVSATVWEVARIEAGMPKMGAELTDATIPAETGWVDRTVSFTKGCYTGQELVARIDSRGSNVPRHLRGLRLGGPAEVGAALVAGEKQVGALTSVAESPALGWVALAYVARTVAVGDALVVEGGPAADVRDLPLRP
jgi:folate-binding protein YgfZ